MRHPAVWALALSTLLLHTRCNAADIAAVQAALVEAFPGWEVTLVDPAPVAFSPGITGQRILLHHGEQTGRLVRALPKTPEATGDKKHRGTTVSEVVQQAAAVSSDSPAQQQEVEHCYIDLVLCPAGPSYPVDLKTRVAWEGREQQRFSTPIAMGEGMGFVWVGKLAIPWDDLIRRSVGLQGGEDRLALAVEGLAVEDAMGWTRNACVGLVAEAQDAAIPYLRAALLRHAATDPQPYVRPLGLIHTPAATQLLRELYAWPDERLSAAAELALMFRPYRPEAKAEYLSILAGQHAVEELAKACVDFQWTDAAPVLRDVCQSPQRWSYFRAAYEAARALEGSPIPPDILDTERKLLAAPQPDKPLSADDAAALVDIMSNAGDKEAAAVAAVTIALRWGRGIEESTRRRGRAIWQALPPEAKAPIIPALQAVQYKVDKEHIAELLETPKMPAG